MEGALLVDEGQLTGGWFVVDMTSIAITDIPAHEREAIKNLTEHLEDPLFLDVETYPTARFELTEVEAVEPDFLLAEGDLTVKDVTRAIQFPVSVASGTYSTRFQIDRFDWNIAYTGGFGATRFADRNFVDELIQLDIRLVPR